MRKSAASTFKFRRTDRIGAAGAEEDGEYLNSCFVDNGDLSLLEDLSDNRLIVIGRTGTGKTALLRRLGQRHPERIIEVRPQSLALEYIVNSTILNTFAAIGVNLDPFFGLLWRHVFTVEILCRHFQEHGPPESPSFLDWLRELVSSTSRQKQREMNRAIKYLEEWGQSFWEETECRVKEVTQKIESQLGDELKATIGGKYAGLSAGAKLVDKLSAEERAELVSRGQDIVAKAQVRDLHEVIPLLDKVLGDRQKQYYVLVDGLDENWVEDRLRYRLIMALILTARDLIKVKNAKIILAVRRDLIDRVFRLTRNSGFQEEKYQSLYLPLSWTRTSILEVLDKRVRYLVAHRYKKTPVSYRDLLPSTVNSLDLGDYIYGLARRPRDVIALFNYCILAGVDQPRINLAQLAIAEGEYSRSRVRALADEWSADYPSIMEFARVLNRRPSSFKLSAVTDHDLEELCLEIVANDPAGSDQICEWAKGVVEPVVPARSFKYTLFHIFYKVGLVGLKLTAQDTASWADELGQAVSSSQITEDTGVVVNPAYARALGVAESKSRRR